MTNEEIVRACFEDRVKEIHFIADELKKLKPMFTLEFNEAEGRYKYIFIDTLFKIFEPLFTENVNLSAELIDYKNKHEMEAFQLTTCSKDPVKPPYDPVIFDIAQNMGSLIVDEVTGKISVTVSPLQRIYRDRWSAPEDGGTLLFFTNKSATDYIRWYNKRYNNLSSAPDEYTSHEPKPSYTVPIEDLELVIEKRPDYIPYCILKSTKVG